MSISIRTGLNALRAARHLGVNQRALSRSLDHISSGLRISRAADDAAGLAVATNLETTRLSLRQAIRSANDGISIIQTSEGAVNTISEMLQRMRELAMQGSSETLDDDERAYLEDEFTQQVNDIKRLGNQVEYNGLKLLSASPTSVDVQVGISNASTSRITIPFADMRSLYFSVRTESVGNITDSRSSLDVIDVALDSVNSMLSKLGASQNRIESAINNAEIYSESLAAAESRILDADLAWETAQLARFQIMQSAGVAALAQAKNMDSSIISLLS